MLALHSAANRSFRVFNLTIQMKRFTLIIPFLLILLPLLAQENPIATRDSLYGGCLPTPKREYDAMPRVDWEAMGLTPRDAHPSRLVLNHPPVGNQGREGSCTAWALGYCAVGVLGYERFKDDWERQGRSPSFVFNATQAKGAYYPSCSDGAYLGRVMGFVAENGVCSLELMPYNEGNCSIRPTDQAKEDAIHYRVKYATIDASNPEEFRNAIASGHPVVISIPMTPEFRKTWLWGRDWVEDPDKTSNFWHAVCVVGYDDTRASYSPGAADSAEPLGTPGGICRRWSAQRLVLHVVPAPT